VVSPPEAVAALEGARAAAAVTYRTRPSAVLVKPYAVGEFNYWCERLVLGRIDETTLSDIIIERALKRMGMLSVWESIEIELTGTLDGYLVEIRIIPTGDVWWIAPDDVLRAVR
jgi:hypothetical protein